MKKEFVIRKIFEPEVIHAATLASGVIGGKKMVKIQQFQHTNKEHLLLLIEDWQNKHNYVGVYRISCIGTKQEVVKWVKERVKNAYQKHHCLWLNELPISD